jgi:hypothetical protein
MKKYSHSPFLTRPRVQQRRMDTPQGGVTLRITTLARRRHTRTPACLPPPHPRPLTRESESSSGAARARRMTASSAASHAAEGPPHRPLQYLRSRPRRGRASRRASPQSPRRSARRGLSQTETAPSRCRPPRCSGTSR